MRGHPTCRRKRLFLDMRHQAAPLLVLFLLACDGQHKESSEVCPVVDYSYCLEEAEKWEVVECSVAYWDQATCFGGWEGGVVEYKKVLDPACSAEGMFFRCLALCSEAHGCSGEEFSECRGLCEDPHNGLTEDALVP